MICLYPKCAAHGYAFDLRTDGKPYICRCEEGAFGKEEQERVRENDRQTRRAP